MRENEVTNEIGETYVKMVEWVLSQDPKLHYIMQSFPPCCVVESVREVRMPGQGQQGSVASYMEMADGSMAVKVVVDDVAGICRPEWLRVVGERPPYTKQWVQAILNGVN